jgi:hypothetical protein
VYRSYMVSEKHRSLFYDLCSASCFMESEKDYKTHFLQPADKIKTVTALYPEGQD